MDRAEKRLAGRPSRRPRRDRGRSRLHPDVASEVEGLLGRQERPAVMEIRRSLAAFCESRGLRTPARATLYEAMARARGASWSIAELPGAVQEALYNLPAEGEVPGHQLAFHCFNHGSLEAVSFAAGLPWLALYQAALKPGWRPRSRGLLEAVRKVRGI